MAVRGVLFAGLFILALGAGGARAQESPDAGYPDISGYLKKYEKKMLENIAREQAKDRALNECRAEPNIKACLGGKGFRPEDFFIEDWGDEFPVDMANPDGPLPERTGGGQAAVPGMPADAASYEPSQAAAAAAGAAEGYDGLRGEPPPEQAPAPAPEPGNTLFNRSETGSKPIFLPRNR